MEAPGLACALPKGALMDARAWLEVAKPLTDRIAAATGVGRSTVVAILILLIGFIAAALLGRLARRLVARSARWIGSLQPGTISVPGFDRAEKAVGRAVYWLVVVCAVMAATETLGLPVVRGRALWPRRARRERQRRS